jgi:hypothetical protein
VTSILSFDAAKQTYVLQGVDHEWPAVDLDGIMHYQQQRMASKEPSLLLLLPHP